MSRQLPLAQPTVAASKKNPRADIIATCQNTISLLPAASPAGTIRLKGVAGRFFFLSFFFFRLDYIGKNGYRNGEKTGGAQ